MDWLYVTPFISLFLTYLILWHYDKWIPYYLDWYENPEKQEDND